MFTERLQLNDVGEIKVGKGLIRTFDLISELQCDIDEAYEALEKKRESQFLRRALARSVFAYIEALIECIKVEVRSTVRSMMFRGLTVTLSSKDRKTLQTLKIGEKANSNFLPLDQSLKQTFKLASKIWELDFQLSTETECYQGFRTAKAIRNRLMHPRTFYDTGVSDQNMCDITTAYMWVKDEFSRLMQQRVNSLI